jgi:CRP/FNR family transcriptional regulator
MASNRLLCLRDLPLFELVDKTLFSNVCLAASKKYYQRGDVLFSQGDPSDTLYLIKEGSFKIVRVNEDGKEMILHLAGRGEVLGESALFREGSQPAAAVALEKSKVCALSRRRFEETIRENPDFALQVIFSLGNRLENTWARQTELRRGTTRERVLHLLIGLAAEHGEPCSEGTLVKIRLSQQEIADFVGSSRVMVAQSIKELTVQNYIFRQGKYYLLKDRCF